MYNIRLAQVLAIMGAVLLGTPHVALAKLLARPTPVEVVAPKAPTPVSIEGKNVLVYELHITNFGPLPLKLRDLRIYAADDKHPPTDASGGVLADYSGAPLLDLLYPLHNGSHMLPAPAGKDDPAELDVGQRMIAFMYITLPPGSKVQALRHRLQFEVLDPSHDKDTPNDESVLDDIMLPIQERPPMVLAPPFKDGIWLAGNGPSNDSAHRRSIIAVGGHAYLAQRFAIDWVMVGNNGDTSHDSRDKNENFWGFGQSVLAVHDGEVTEAVDDIPDNVPGKLPAEVTLRNIMGNHVIMRLAPDVYAVYCHLKEGSVVVQVGQVVKTGAQLGLVGNSGQTTAPHLHFQITDGDSVIASEGIPYVFGSFRFWGFGKDFDLNKPHPDEIRTLSLPMDDSVIQIR